MYNRRVRKSLYSMCHVDKLTQKSYKRFIFLLKKKPNIKHNQKEIKNLLEKRWFAIFKTRPKFWQWWSTQVKNFLQLKQFNLNVNNNIQLQDNFKLIFIFIPIRSVNASVWKIQYHLITSYPKANMQSKNRQKAWLACSCRSVAHGLKKKSDGGHWRYSAFNSRKLQLTVH